MDLTDEFTLPDGTGSTGATININDMENLHKQFGMKCKKLE